jgi:hypothetical protein
MTQRSSFLLQISVFWALVSACEQPLNLGDSDPVEAGNSGGNGSGRGSGNGGVLGSAGAAGGAGGAGNGSGGSAGADASSQCPFPPSNVPEAIFRPVCGTSPCHDANLPQAYLDLVTPGVETRVVDKPSSCPTELIVDSAAPAKSLLLGKVVSAAVGTFPMCGDPMPPLGVSLSAIQIACVREWVELVARNAGQRDAARDSTDDPSP